MSKSTKELKAEAKEKIRQYQAWLVLQGPAVKAMLAFAENMSIYVPDPVDDGREESFAKRFKPGRGILVPHVVTDQVTIPAGHRIIHLGNDHGYKLAVVDRDDGRIFRMELYEGWEITVPGGKAAVLRKQPNGIWLVHEPPEDEEQSG